MMLRGVSLAEVNIALAWGWPARDAAPRNEGRVFVVDFRGVWEGRSYEEKEVTVYFKWVESKLIPLTVKARYGKNFPKGAGQ